MTPEQRAKIIELPDIEVMARTLFGEARNQGVEGLVAVSNVILRRCDDLKKRYGVGITNVCLRDWQFSCWNDGDPNLPKLLVPPDGSVMYKCRIIAKMATDGLFVDNTDGATHYHHRLIFPWWVQYKGMIFTRQIKDHLFYVEI